MRISNGDLDDAKNTVDYLLVRMIRSTWSARPFDECLTWQRSWSPDFAEGVRLIGAVGDTPHRIFNRWSTVWLPVTGGGDMYSIRIVSPYPGNIPYLPPNPLTVHELTEDFEAADRLLDWLQLCANVHKEFHAAREALHGLISITNTAGQLQRMVPELMRYLPSEYQKAAAKQKRRSSLPFEWSRMDRGPVREAITTIAKCYLLPPLEPGQFNWQMKDMAFFKEITWAYQVTPETCTAEYGWRGDP